jgi:hypothetical protein
MRARLAAISVAAMIAALYLLSARRLPVGANNDDAANVLLARSLAGGSYSFPGGLGAPEEFLPAFPLLLALPVRLAQPHWNVLRAIPLFFAALSLLLSWRLARRFLSPEAAAAAVLLTALNPVLVGLGGLVMPHLPYLALSLALIDGSGASGSRRAFLWLAAGASLAPLLRPQGAVLVAALALAQWRGRGFKRAAAFASLAFLPAAAWTLRNHLRAGASRDYVDIWRAQIASLGGTGRAARHAWEILSTMFGGSFACLPDAPRLVSAALGLGALALAAAGAARLLRKRGDPRALVLAAYTAALVLLHVSWKWVDPRYLIPFAPLLWILVIAAVSVPLAKRRALAGTLLAVFLALPLRLDAPYARRGLEGDGRYQPRTMAWIRDNVPATARLESMNNYTVALLTGRACATQVPVAHGAEWLAQARRDRVDYLHVVLPRPQDEFTVSDFPAGYQPVFARWLDTRPEAAQLYRDLDEGALVYRLNLK